MWNFFSVSVKCKMTYQKIRTVGLSLSRIPPIKSPFTELNLPDNRFSVVCCPPKRYPVTAKNFVES